MVLANPIHRAAAILMILLGLPAAGAAQTPPADPAAAGSPAPAPAGAAPADALPLPGGTVAPWATAAQVAQLQSALAELRRIEAAGGFVAVPAGTPLRRDDRSPAVALLDQRLRQSGDLTEARADPTLFDAALEAAVIRFQARHGLGADGVVGQRSFAMLNEPVGTLIGRVEVNIARLEQAAPLPAGRAVVINMPAFELTAYRDGQPELRMPVIIGRPARATPQMVSPITHLVVNPTWTVPPTILRQDIAPRMMNNPDYVARRGLLVLGHNSPRPAPAPVQLAAPVAAADPAAQPGAAAPAPAPVSPDLAATPVAVPVPVADPAAAGGATVAAGAGPAGDAAAEPAPESGIDWRAVRRGSASVALRQPPGPGNPLGRFKFHMQNRQSIYLHDTNERHLFARAHRDLSSGCVRVGDPWGLAAFVAEGVTAPWRDWGADPAWRTRWVQLPEPVPVSLTYRTIWVDDAGALQVRQDIYGRDRRDLAALRQRGPASLADEES